MIGRVSVVALAAVCLLLGYLWGARPASPADQPGERSYLASLTDDLHLRADQIVEISKLLAEEDKDIQQLIEQQRRRLESPIAARLDRTVDAMLELLDDEQRARYHELTGEQTSDR